MAVPVYAFFTAKPRPEYYQMGKEGRGEAWWKRLAQMTKEQCPEAEMILFCDSVPPAGFLWVAKYPDMETYGKCALIAQRAVHFFKYFDVTVQLGWKRDDTDEAFGKIPFAKETW
jgi:hypothetical protein